MFLQTFDKSQLIGALIPRVQNCLQLFRCEPSQFRILQGIHEPAEARTHGLPFEPRTRGSGRNDHHFELRIFAHAPGQAFGESDGGKILILDEDYAFGTFDGIEE